MTSINYGIIFIKFTGFRHLIEFFAFFMRFRFAHAKPDRATHKQESHGIPWLSSPRRPRSRPSSSVDQWNCSSSVEPVSAFTLEEPPWITVVTSSK